MNFPRILPSTILLLTTQYKVEQVRDILIRNTEERKNFRFTFPLFETHPFEGEVDTNNFNIHSTDNRKNSVVPQIQGWFAAHGNGTKLHINMKLRDHVMVFLPLWYGFLALMWIIFIAITINNIKYFFDGRYYLGILVPPAMFLLVYKLVMSTYKRECQKAQILLVEILNAQLVDSF